MKNFLERIHIPHWLTILLAIVLILKIPSFFEPYAYGDEMIYLSMGQAVRHGEVLYRDIHDNKPPLLYLVAAVAGSLFWFKVILAFWMLATIVVFWKLTTAIFPKDKHLDKATTIIFAILTTLPLLEGNTVNAELFMIGPTIFAFYILLTKKLNFKNLFSAGLLFSVSTLFKVPAAFDIPAIVFYWVIIGGLRLKNIKEVIKNTAIIAAGYLLPILFTFVWYFMKGAFSQYLVAAFLQNVGYLSSYRPSDVQKSFLDKNLPLLIRGFIVLLGAGALWQFKKKISKEFVFISLWLLFALFAVTLSERPYPHYLIQAVPAASLLLGMLFAKRSLEQALTIIPLSVAFFVPFYYHYYHYPTVSYYTRFVAFASKQISRQEYFTSFSPRIPGDYEIANFIVKSTEPNDKVFIWGYDNTQIYALSRRLPPIKYVAQYHIDDFSSNQEVLAGVEKVPPKLIVFLDNSPSFPELTPFLRNNYIQLQAVDGAEIWSLVSPDLKDKIAH